MSYRNPNAIDFGEHKWTAVSDAVAARISASNLPIATKVLMAIQQGMNNWGHTYFGEGELGMIVYGRPASRGMMNTVREKIKQFRQDGFLAPGGEIDCLVPDADLFQRASGRGNVVSDHCWCKAHANADVVYKRWSSSRGWHAASTQPKEPRSAGHDDVPSVQADPSSEHANPESVQANLAACRQTDAPNRSDLQERFPEGLEGIESLEGKEGIESLEGVDDTYGGFNPERYRREERAVTDVKSWKKHFD